MNVEQVYSQFGVPENLQKHMLEVGAVAWFVLDSWIGSVIDKDSIQYTCLFHDIAKPITFDMEKQEGFVSSQKERDQLRAHQMRLIQQYGRDEHKALQLIFAEFGLSEKAQHLIANLEWNYVSRLIVTGDTESLVPIYCDMRVSPRGLISVHERIAELNTRHPILELEERLSSAQALEDFIGKNTSANLVHLSQTDLLIKARQLAELKMPITIQSFIEEVIKK